MDSTHWHWEGRIDVAGVPDDTLNALFGRWWAAAQEAGCDLQIAKVDGDLYDTDWWRLKASWSQLARPFADLMADLAKALPYEHEPMTVSGAFPMNCERMDIRLRSRRVELIPYQQIAGTPLVYSPTLAAAEQREQASVLRAA